MKEDSEAEILLFDQKPDGNEEAVIGRGGEGEEVGLARVIVDGWMVVQDLNLLWYKESSHVSPLKSRS